MTKYVVALVILSTCLAVISGILVAVLKKKRLRILIAVVGNLLALCPALCVRVRLCIYAVMSLFTYFFLQVYFLIRKQFLCSLLQSNLSGREKETFQCLLVTYSLLRSTMIAGAVLIVFNLLASLAPLHTGG